jgi:TATA-box binding protein (TBP) (component of TFIID and TFIIIB)
MPPRATKKHVPRLVSVLPDVNQRDYAFVRQVIAGVKGPFIDNVVTNCRIHVEPNIDEAPLAFNIRDAAWRLMGKHDPTKFKASASFRLSVDPSLTGLVFPSECVVMTGVRCEELVLTAALRIARYYSSVYQRICRLVSYQINNTHAVFDMGYPLDLRGIHAACPHSFHHTSRIKCVILKIQVPYHAPPPLPTGPFYHVVQQNISTPIPPAAAAAPAPTPPVSKKKPPRTKANRKSGTTKAVKRKAPEAAEATATATPPPEPILKRRRVVYQGTTHLETTTTKKKQKTPTAAAAARKRVKNPDDIAVTIWESGFVGIMARNEDQLFRATSRLAVFLAQYTMKT